MLRMSAYLLVLVFVTACGGSGGGGGDGDTTAPAVIVCFPPAVSLTDGPTISVRGTATDGTAITALLVNGVAATTIDGFANWTVPNLPIALGANVIAVDATDSAGNNNPAAATFTITRDPLATTAATIGAGTAFANVRDVAIDAPRSRLLVVDDGGAGTGALVAVDLATGNRTDISRDALGAGIPATMDTPNAIHLNIAGSAAYVTDSGLSLVILINFISGIRSVASDGILATESFTDPLGVAFNPNSNTIFWTDEGANQVLTAPVASGNTNTVFSDNTNLGPNYSNPNRIILDFTNNRALVTERLGAGSILAANLANGDRSVLASGAVGTGGPAGFSFPTGIVLDLVSNRLVTQLAGSDATVFVSPSNGNRTTISQNGVLGVGPAFSSEQGLDFENQKLLVYLVDGGPQAVYVVDVVSGDRVILSK